MSEQSELRARLIEAAGPRCEWPGCTDPGEQMAHLEHRGMGGSKTRNNLNNVAWLCVRHHDTLDGRTALGTLRWELNQMLKAVTTRRRVFRD